jgi:FlaA1/EpsC-like NDP-sugar epimerase
MGDVRDYGELKYACKDVNIVFHLAAIKHVPICERQPYEAIKTNINGTRNVVRASIDNGVEKVIDVSSDKAVLPINTYGMTKSVGEKLTLNASKLGNNKTKFMCIRGGNVLGTNGSVVPLFINTIKRFNKVSITDERMTRYFLTLQEAIRLLFVATKSDINGGLFVMKMPACRITDLADVLIEYHGDKNTKKEIIGIRPGEKIHEILVSKYESPTTFEYNSAYYLIMNNGNGEIISKYNKVNFKEYTSNDNLMNKKEIKSLLDRGKYLK